MRTHPVDLLHVLVDARPGGRVAAVGERIARRCERTPATRLHTLNPAGDADMDSIAAATAVVVTTPIYKASYAGSLKSWLDFLPVEALWWKPTAIIGVGGSDHHHLALDAQLRFTLTWFGALCLPVNAYLTPADAVEGKLTAEAAAEIDGIVDAVCELARRLGGMRARGPVPLAGRSKGEPE